MSTNNIRCKMCTFDKSINIVLLIFFSWWKVKSSNYAATEGNEVLNQKAKFADEKKKPNPISCLWGIEIQSICSYISLNNLLIDSA